MPDLAILAQTTVPPSAQDKLLPILNSGLRAYLASPGKNVQPEVLQYVAVGLHIHASRSLANLGTLPPTRSDLLPLEVLTKLLKRNTVSLDEVLPTLTLDAIVAYPNHVSTIKQLLSEVLKDNVIQPDKPRRIFSFLDWYTPSSSVQELMRVSLLPFGMLGTFSTSCE
jgi:hypothetical protein